MATLLSDQYKPALSLRKLRFPLQEKSIDINEVHPYSCKSISAREVISGDTEDPGELI
jgi:hypothetical protein